MALDRRITDLDSIGTLSTGDLFVVTDADQSNIAKNADIDIITSYVVARVPSSARAFGGAVNEIATWAEGNNTDIIPSSKLPEAIVPDLSNLVTLDTAQHITGDKILSAGTTIDSQIIVTAGNAQTILGKKTIASPDLTGTTDVDIIRFSDGSTQNTAGGSGSGTVTKAAVDLAIGVSPTGNSGQFYNQQGNFLDPQYRTIERAPIILDATVENITITGTRSNVVVTIPGSNEMSTITMQNDFDSTPTQYTTVFASPNTSLVPALVLSTGSQGRQLSLTEADGTLHRFAYTTNGNYRLLDGGLTGTVRLGATAVATTATVTAAVSVPDQTSGQTITLTGDQTGVFSVGDFISPLNNNFGAYRGVFIESVTLNGGNTDLVGISNGAATFQTTSTLYLAGPATEIQGTVPTFSGDPDIGDVVYTSSIPATEFTIHGVNTSAHLIQVANAYAALETAITTDGIVTDNGDGTSSITIDYGTETNIDSSFTITGGLNNMESIVNTDGTGSTLSAATTITVVDPEATEVVSFTSSVTDASDNNVDTIAAQIVSAVNNNIETPINFDAEYDAATTTLILTAEEAGNTNPWTIVFNNNGITGANAGNLSTITVQTGEQINQIERLTVRGHQIIAGDDAQLSVNTRNAIIMSSDSSINLLTDGTAFISADRISLSTDDVAMSDSVGSIFNTTLTDTYFNLSGADKNFNIIKQGGGSAYSYNAGTDTTVINSDTVLFLANNFIGLPTGADGLSLTDTVNLNLLQGATVISTVVLPSSSGTTIIQGTTNEIINTVSGDTNTLSLDTAITGAITANTAKTGITTAQAAAITSNTGKTGITVAQSNAIIANTSKTGITTAQSTAIINNTNKVGITTVQATAITNNTAKVGITTAQATAITDNTAKVSVAGLTQVGGAIIASDSLLYYDNTTPRRKVFSSVPLSIFDNDAGFSTSSGTVTSVTGTSNQVNIANGTTTPVVSLSSTITNAITANTSKTGITTAQANAITANTSKTGITTAQATAITNNTAKTGITTAQSNAITANTSKVGITTAQATAITNNTAKNSYPTADSTKLGTIETNADVTDTTNVVGSLTAGTNITIAADGTISAAGGGTGASLSADNDFTGENTFSNTAGINARRVTSTLNSATNISLGNNSLGLSSATVSVTGTVLFGTSMTISGTEVAINPFSISNRDFNVNKTPSGVGIGYNATTDTLSSDAVNFEGIADQETGSFTPVFAQGGVEGTKNGFYEKVGKTVTAVVEVVMAANTDISSLTMTLASLPYAFRSSGTRDVAMGTWWTGTSGVPFLASSSGVIVPSNTGVFFLDPSTNSFLSGSEVRGYIGFTMSYIVA